MNITYNVYCDESCHLKHDGINDMVIGAIWCDQRQVKKVNLDIREIKKKNGIAPGAELKWTKVAPVKKEVYEVKRLMQMFQWNLRVLHMN